MTTTLPYGTWPSPLQAEDVFASSRTPADLQVDGDDVWWTELRPAEGGRKALVRWRDGEVTDVGPGDWNCRTRVHEYGGAPFTVRDRVAVGASFADQRWWRLDADEPQPVTPQLGVAAGQRFADARFVPGSETLVAVRELHDGAGEPAKEVVVVDVDSQQATALVTGRDFVAAPRPSPDGRRLCWLAWDHPFMPWDAAELWVADLDGSSLSGARRIAGGEGRTVTSPLWTGPDTLLYVEEVDGWSRPVRHELDTDEVARWTDREVEVGHPAWGFGGQQVAALPDGSQVWVATDDGIDQLWHVTGPLNDTPGTTILDVPGVRFDHLHAWRDGVVLRAVEADGTIAVRAWSPDDGVSDLRRYDVEGLRPGDLPEVRPVSMPTPDGATTHAFVHLPANADHVGPDDERPPLLVFIHGGPTSATSAVTSRGIAYWTTRGFAVADVNYRGSTGYGQDYREALLDNWGVTDVLDVIAVAEGLAAEGTVDGDRMAIRGGSAGGFTTLAALTTPEQPFTCGTSFFGVADLRALAEHTHKFESRYLDRLVGRLPEDAEVYEERSPLSRTEHLQVPVLVLQGLEDEVVPPAQSEAIVAAAAANGVPHAYLEFEGEQHGFRKLENLVTWYESELAFYGQVMGFTPAGDLPELELSSG